MSRSTSHCFHELRCEVEQTPHERRATLSILRFSVGSSGRPSNLSGFLDGVKIGPLNQVSESGAAISVLFNHASQKIDVPSSGNPRQFSVKSLFRSLFGHGHEIRSSVSRHADNPALRCTPRRPIAPTSRKVVRTDRSKLNHILRYVVIENSGRHQLLIDRD